MIKFAKCHNAHVSAEEDFEDQGVRKVNPWLILGRGIRILNRLPIIPAILPNSAATQYFRHTVAGAYFKSFGAQKLDQLAYFKMDTPNLKSYRRNYHN
ncbi:hypothetical protein TNCV_2478611 [Trichonephila clavipes]|nr:hypothetical protein TNCV_2478611 [Trichonephila clavipes]